MTGHLTEMRDIIGLVNNASRGALVHEVSPTEKPAESAVKERQHVMYHWLEECKKSATRATFEGG